MNTMSRSMVLAMALGAGCADVVSAVPTDAAQRGDAGSDRSVPPDVSGPLDVGLDAGAQPCRTAGDCAPGEFCLYPSAGCATAGTCATDAPCAEAAAYCGCEGSTYLGCAPSRPTRNEGVCEGFDAGMPHPTPARPCSTRADCGTVAECYFWSSGCSVVGTCSHPRGCAFVATYCGCDGVTFRACPNAATQRYSALGPCVSSTDAGPRPSCEGASIDPSGNLCVGPADGPLPIDCCTWNCDLRLSTCESPPPRCASADLVNTVGVRGCWGPCVPPRACAPMACAPDNACTPSWRCEAMTRRCVPMG